MGAAGNHRVRATANEPSGYHDRPQRGGRPAGTRSARTLEVRTLCEPGDVDHGRLALGGLMRPPVMPMPRKHFRNRTGRPGGGPLKFADETVGWRRLPA